MFRADFGRRAHCREAYLQASWGFAEYFAGHVALQARAYADDSRAGHLKVLLATLSGILLCRGTCRLKAFEGQLAHAWQFAHAM